ncbi:MAG TPA: 30S ribosome-binding factor RbfA [Saprospiraceae bacterium]|nr:30S ribosome-binding factor RbfA [Saprospiraceae bacterium]MCB9270947.1 30S ribosome-binding factor RbfA [Lewinellaceae bacterium]HPG08170.1 30S ribosome-binding factor RbfA [Saprospiraceae bacterium]HPQ98333.1 30S ribosome-binding factor RbfA [Saprospiraceae bacterium]HQU51375.1 30S ribosome-binding factor RbfA [Saprospiraceae bacterium]
MPSIRQSQVAELVKRNISMFLTQEGSYLYGDPLVTVTNVVMSPDLLIAKVYLSVFNTENKQAVILELEENYSRVRQAMSIRLRKQLRRMPQFEFFLDDTLDEMYRLRDLFQRLREDHQMGEEE